MTGLAELYPFLEPTPPSDPAAVLADVTRSTREKVDEIGHLRAAVVEADADRMASCGTAMAARFAAGGRMYTFGNGGSSTDADALAALFVRPGPGHRPLPAAALTDDVATLTALANDVGFDVVFSRPLAAAGRAQDIAVGLSTSGNSANVVRGLAVAHERGLLTVATAGYAGGAMAEAAARGEIEYLFVVPSASVHRIQEAQTTIFHVLWELVQRALGSVPDGP
jgi:D-sedoheptulose 7-phosphate isomerase